MQRGNNQTPRGRGRGRGRGNGPGFNTNRGHGRGASRGRGGRGHTDPRSIEHGVGSGADDPPSRGGRGTPSRGRRGRRAGPQIYPNAWTPHRGRRGFLRGIGFDVPNMERPVVDFLSSSEPGRTKIDLRNRPLLRPVVFVRSATVLFQNEDEIFQPEIVENEMNDAPTADRVESLFARVPMPAFEGEPEATDSDARPLFADYSVPAEFEDDDDDIPTLEFGFSEAELVTVPSRPSRSQQKSRLNQLLDNLAQTSLASDNEKTTADFTTKASDPPNAQDDMASRIPSLHSLLPREGTDDYQMTVMTSTVIEVPKTKASITDAPILTSFPEPSTPLAALEPMTLDTRNLSAEAPEFIFDTEGASHIDGEPDILYHSYSNVVGRPSQRTITDDDNDVIVFARKEVTSVRKAPSKRDKAPVRTPRDPTSIDTEGPNHAGGEPSILCRSHPNLVGEPAQRPITGDDNDVVVFTRKEVASVHEAMSEPSAIRTTRKPKGPKSSTEEISFIIDTEGTTHADEEPNILYHSQPHVMGEPTRRVTTDDADEVIVFTHEKTGSERVGSGPVVPPTISFADCKPEFSGKGIPRMKAPRRRRRRGTIGPEAGSKRPKGNHSKGVPRLGDSDIDWGSDGPPQKASSTAQEKEVGDHGMEIDSGLEESAYRQLISGLLHPETISIDDLIAQEKIREEDEESEDARGSSGEDDSEEEEDTSDAHDDEISSSEVDAAIRAEEMQLEGDSDNSDGEESELDTDDDSDGRIEDISNSYFDFPRGKSRKGRKVTFKAVENDSSDEPEIEDMIAKRNRDLAGGRNRKKEAAYIPDELRDLWQRSREKKAQYKKDREEARRVGLLLPSRKSGKRKDKFGNRVHDNREGGKAAFIQVPPSADFSAIGDQIRAFVGDLGIETMELPPMDKRSRKKVHVIAQHFGLKSKSRGAEGNRYTTLIRTSRTGIGGGKTSQRKLKRLLGGERKNSEGPPKNRLFQRDGDIVGSKAEPIGESNVGFRLLSRMGWSKGERIGTSGGLADPLRAVIKNSKLGLGAITYGQS